MLAWEALYLQRAICRPEGPSGLKDSFRPETSLCWPESSLCYPERAFFWSNGALFVPKWHFVGQSGSRAALRGLCQPELALNWPEGSLCRPEFDLTRSYNAREGSLLA